MSPSPEHEPVSLHLSSDAAVVLSAFLNRVDLRGGGRVLEIEHPGEVAAVWALEAALDKALVTPFHPEYETIVAAALDRLRSEAGL